MKALVAVLSLAFGAAILAQTAAPKPSDHNEKKKEAEQSDRLRKLSRRERKSRTERLGDRHQDFLADVTPILLSAEIDNFLSLETDTDRDAFIDDFWRRRDAMQSTTNGAFRNAYYARLEVAKAQFKRTDTDRAKLFLLHGPPSEVVRADCASLLQPIEIWKYAQIPRVGTNLRLLLYKPRMSGDYRLWNPLGGSMAIQELLADDSAAASAAQPAARRPLDESASPYAYINRIQLECRDGEEIMRAITSMVQGRIDLISLFEPRLDPEEVQNILRAAVIADPNAPKLNAEFSVRYPARDGSRTDVQLLLLVPKSEVTPAQVAGAEVYTIDVTGEILRDGNLWEKYRYRFDFPGDFTGDKLPIVIDRLLRPADYRSRVKVTDASTGAQALVESDLTVPELFLPTTDPVAEAAPAETASAEVQPATPAPPKHELVVEETRLRIVPPPDDIVSGIETIDTVISGQTIKAVEFWLDGRKIAVRRSPPFSLDLDFGIIPHPRRIRAIGLDAKGEPLTGDDVTVNIGTDPFRVRITSPRVAPHLVGPSRVEMEVSVPDGEELESLELFWNETRLAAMYDGPFVQTVDIPATQGVGYLRAVATLKNAPLPPVEDVVMINTPAYMESVDVHLVELPTTVLVNGKPSSGLTEKAFKILDEGRPVPLAKFEYVKNLPLSIGLAIDTSGSMLPRMVEAQKAGAQFFEKVIKRGDKGFLIAFDTSPMVVQKWSPRVADMQAGLARLRAEEMTALYDAVVFSLYHFQGIRGQKALVLISDGKDTASKFSFEQALEYARRAAVPIYAIGLGIRANDIDVRYKLSKLSSETGGSVYYIDQARDLQRVYDEIQEELRSQYVLGFYPAQDVKPGGKWREVTVQVTEGKAKTIKGYFP
ncbi:MAG: VWA domain-containing protein [Acidobacteriota bacterium]